MAMPITHHRFTVDQYHRMVDAGILTEDDRVELLDGEIVEMSPIGHRHVACVVRLGDLLTHRGGRAVLVSVQNPLLLGERSEPEPDIVVMRRPADLSGAWLPKADDTLLVIEVADSSLHYDRSEKLPLYAESGIPEVWIVNLPADRIEIYRDPAGSEYRTLRIVGREGTLTPQELPTVSIRADEIL